ncbi:uncharacterized protein LOC127804738 [Diospyros lotus]|uniref:uncharacterized protein LOC127804738 n=1 Tax=Diospyros lotus TaxID=55363 RepID=UPI0022577A58|nr:uncharacterized protein LOC127804738 [Diospyros lotus]
MLLCLSLSPHIYIYIYHHQPVYRLSLCEKETTQFNPMEYHKENNNAWLSVPQFGDWDQRGPLPDYSGDFSKIRAMRKQNKREIGSRPSSLGNEQELNRPPPFSAAPSRRRRRCRRPRLLTRRCPAIRKLILSYFNCWAKA